MGGDAKTDDLINTLLHNYNIKFNEELGRYKREKFNISIGDESPARRSETGQGLPRCKA